ncbi:MAG TPA: cell envelope integrity protein TolA, partial [Xanthomonadales bacterium]|nr:cell envelope integrity protein TolA [Xanthomonadales bacterium]
DSLWQPFLLAMGVHVLLAALVVLGTLNWKPFKQHQPMALTIEAVIVDTTQLATRREEAQKEAEAAQKRQELEERRAEELEQQKQREREQELEKQQQAELDKQKQIEAEKQKQVEAEKQKQAEVENQRRKQLEEERKKKEAQEKLEQLRKEQEKKREEERLQREKELEQVRKQQEEAEKKRKQEEERLKQLEARDKALEQEKLKQQQAADALLAKQDQEAKSLAEGRRADLSDKYQLAIQQLVKENWLRPPTAKPGLRCTLKIAQIPGGEVISAVISGSCNGDEATKRSIVAAVERIDALPYRGFEEVFAREIDFEFIYNGD